MTDVVASLSDQNVDIKNRTNIQQNMLPNSFYKVKDE